MSADAAVNPKPSKPRQGIEVSLVTLLVMIVPVAASIYMAPRRAWFVVVASMIVYLLFLGKWICGRPLGILINERNIMSLSRLQMVAWTVLILSAFLTIALKRLSALSSNPSAMPLNIAMDWHLWALMGISTTSLVGTPLLLAPKASQAPADQSVQKASAALDESPDSINANRQGILYSNANIGDAALSDIFEGDEIGNTAYIDAAKVQMFYFTIVALIAYGYALYSALPGIYPQPGFAMPVPPDGLLALLGISNAGYLTSKTSDKTPTAKP
jgi:hypothetical protein